MNKNLARMRQSTSPVAYARTVRPDIGSTLTSGDAGKIIPLAAIPLLREDALRTGVFSAVIESMETAEMLMNDIYIKLRCEFIPNLAFNRFESMEALEAAYQGNGDDDYIVTETMGASGEPNELLKKLGIHVKNNSTYNSYIAEAYNKAFNYRAENVSDAITQRTQLQNDLAPAFWINNKFGDYVNDFDDAVQAGEVALTIAEAQMPVVGIGVNAGAATSVAGATHSWSGGQTASDSNIYTSNDDTFSLRADGVDGAPEIFAEMQQNGVTVSLANIEQAKNTAAFARLRTQYEGHTDDDIIDALMSGLRVTSQDWKRPILLGETVTTLGMSKRYAMDGANLDESVTNGASMLDMRVRMPACPCGGTLLITAEITPDMVYERTGDVMSEVTDVSQFPDSLRDTLDTQKVEAVLSSYIDTEHANPDDVFAYAPMNHKWMRKNVRLGGKFYRAEGASAYAEDRERVWASEPANPVFTEDFYVVTDLNKYPFIDASADSFELKLDHVCAIQGLTQFGNKLIEATAANYDLVQAKAPTEIVDPDA